MRVVVGSPALLHKNIGFLIPVFLLLVLGIEARIRIASDVDEQRINMLISDVREKTGLASLLLDRENYMAYEGSSGKSKSSKTMRDLLVGAIDDNKNTFVIVNSSRNENIHFSQTDQGTVDLETGKILFRVRFDFEDFERSRIYSSDEALGSFSLGINLFHEIDHKVSYNPNDPIPNTGVRPDKSSPEARGVIEKTNIVRRELGLITRDSQSHSGSRYNGIVGFFRNTYQILFHDESGNRKFLRWKVGRRS